MSDEEYNETLRIALSLIISFLLFPVLCCNLIIFGYVFIGFIVTDIVLGILIIPSFILRTKFIGKYKKYASEKRFYFETISYISCLVFAVATAFAVKESGGVFTYYFLNIYIQPLYIIFVFVVMGFHIATSKKIAKAYIEERNKRQFK